MATHATPSPTILPPPTASHLPISGKQLSTNPCRDPPRARPRPTRANLSLPSRHLGQLSPRPARDTPHRRCALRRLLRRLHPDLRAADCTNADFAHLTPRRIPAPRSSLFPPRAAAGTPTPPLVRSAPPTRVVRHPLPRGHMSISTSASARPPRSRRHHQTSRRHTFDHHPMPEVLPSCLRPCKWPKLGSPYPSHIHKLPISADRRQSRSAERPPTFSPMPSNPRQPPTKSPATPHPIGAQLGRPCPAMPASITALSSSPSSACPRSDNRRPETPKSAMPDISHPVAFKHHLHELDIPTPTDNDLVAPSVVTPRTAGSSQSPPPHDTVLGVRPPPLVHPSVVLDFLPLVMCVGSGDG